MKKIQILLIITLLVSSISFVGCCEIIQTLGKMTDKNNQEATDSEVGSVETKVNDTSTSLDEATTSDTTTSEGSSNTTDTEETTTNEPDSELIHGVIPTKVTINSDYGSGDLKANYYFEFWNVGKLGGEYYSDAILTTTLLEVPEGVDMSQPVENMYGYFTGGPNGELYLTNPDNEKEYRCYLKNGKELISPTGMIFPIDNPEAFKGWID